MFFTPMDALQAWWEFWSSLSEQSDTWQRHLAHSGLLVMDHHRRIRQTMAAVMPHP